MKKALLAAVAVFGVLAVAQPAQAQREDRGRHERGDNDQRRGGDGPRGEWRGGDGQPEGFHTPDRGGRRGEWRDRGDGRWAHPGGIDNDGRLRGGPDRRGGWAQRDGRFDRDWERPDGGDRREHFRGGERHDDWGRRDRGRDFGYNDWSRDRHRSDHSDSRWRHAHRDFDRPRYSDWRRVPHGRYFDRGYVTIIGGYWGYSNYRWWGYPGWHRPHRRYVVGYVLPDYLYWEPIPYDLYYRLPPAPYGCRYVMVDRDILLIVVSTGLVLDALLYY